MPTTVLDVTHDLTNISEIDVLIDASYKSKEGTAGDRVQYRDVMRARKAQIIAELDKRPKKPLFKSADDIIKELGNVRKPRKAKFGEERIVICGATNWVDKLRIRTALKQIPRKDIQFVIIGTSKGAEQTAISIAKEQKLSVVQMHPQQHLGNSAIHIRNNEVFRFFKPTKVIAFHNDIETSTSSAMFLKLGKKAEIPVVLISKKDDAKTIKKKMKVTID